MTTTAVQASVAAGALVTALKECDKVIAHPNAGVDEALANVVAEFCRALEALGVVVHGCPDHQELTRAMRYPQGITVQVRGARVAG